MSAYSLALIAAAGEHGELHHLQAAGLLTETTARAACAAHDRDTAISAAAALGFTITVDSPAPADPDRGVTWSEVSKEARVLVGEHWPAIRAVAAALLAAPNLTLTGDQVAALITANR
ncbi:hypothetical protein QLX52_30385 [Streptomyces albus]|uniref:hypothetical protein n=1 Tax=Streptomyces albus TaxID=1888 RepID=UPI0024AE69E3|nr:hypothetical protein [Streptomyces albus]MDI6413119.1 hypothetical protein [Streptomyces albus]